MRISLTQPAAGIAVRMEEKGVADKQKWHSVCLSDSGQRELVLHEGPFKTHTRIVGHLVLKNRWNKIPIASHSQRSGALRDSLKSRRGPDYNHIAQNRPPITGNIDPEPVPSPAGLR